MPPRVSEQDKTPDKQTEQKSRDGYLLVTPGGVVPHIFDNKNKANEHGVVTYGRNDWWALIPVIAADLPPVSGDNDE